MISWGWAACTADETASFRTAKWAYSVYILHDVDDWSLRLASYNTSCSLFPALDGASFSQHGLNKEFPHNVSPWTSALTNSFSDYITWKCMIWCKSVVMWCKGHRAIHYLMCLHDTPGITCCRMCIIPQVQSWHLVLYWSSGLGGQQYARIACVWNGCTFMRGV